MEGAREPEAGTKEPSGVVGVERSEGCARNWGGPPRPRHGGWREATPVYNRWSREVPGSREEVGRGRSSRRRRGKAQPRLMQRTPASSMYDVRSEGAGQ